MDESELERIGVYDPTATDARDRLELVQYLLSQGATEDELVEAARTNGFGPLALELALRPPGPLVDFHEWATSDETLDPAEAARLWRALGFPDPESAEPRLSSDEAEALLFIARTGRQFLGQAYALALARVIGATTSRLAEAVIDAFRVQFEAPQRAGGVPYAKVVAEYAEIARGTLPHFLNALGVIMRRHIVVAAMGKWFFDQEESVTRRDLIVGFADLVGYTNLATALSPSRLAALIESFEETVNEVLSRRNARVVKLAGDGAMFVSEDAVAACKSALDLVDWFEKEAELPVRVALAAGWVVSLRGDYFGDVVNLAARLCAMAPASSVVIAESVRERLDGSSFEFDPMPPQSLKGFQEPARAYRLRRSDE